MPAGGIKGANYVKGVSDKNYIEDEDTEGPLSTYSGSS